MVTTACAANGDAAETICQCSDVAGWQIKGQQSLFGRQSTTAASFGGRELDASLLQLTDLGFLDAHDPRQVATFDAIERDLKKGPFLFRYVEPDDFGEPETAFNFCTFWFIEALHQNGRVEEARAIFEEMLARRTQAGLLSEDISVEDGELWGNYPQTYSLVGIINCAVMLSRSWTDVR